MCNLTIFTLLLLSFFCATSSYGSIPDFFAELYAEVETEYIEHKAVDYKLYCDNYGVDPTASDNIKSFHHICFMHDLLTTYSAIDFAQGGFLKIPYLWHWNDPNPRHSILALPDTILLKRVKPPSNFRRYATKADIDRIPILFLGDLVSSTPNYYHSACGSFYTFGWCSEREMSFTAILSSWGYEAKIVQSGIHTFSRVLVSFTNVAGGTLILSAKVDNTFDSVNWEVRTPPVDVHEWRHDIGEGTQIEWYNTQALDESQLDALEAIGVSESTRSRILSMIRNSMLMSDR
jgi:hypothetical protein